MRLEFSRTDWALLRQTCALALAYEKPALLAGAGAFLRLNEQFLPVFNDMARACAVLEAGSLECQGDDVLIAPHPPRAGTFDLETGKYSSAVELFLFLLPALFRGAFRTVLNIRGVTHSPHSYATGFIKETLLPLLELRGLYASLELRRFGFYGSGGGLVEARAYPRELREPERPLFSGPRVIEGARIFISGVSPDLAGREADMLRGSLGLGEGRVSTIEVRDADGMGNSVQVYLRCGDDMLVLHRELELFDWRGDFIFDEEKFGVTMAGLFDEAKGLASGREVPVALARELAVFYGADDAGALFPVVDDNPLMAETCRVASLISGS